jgi:1-acyl-sn-glycerol-3-phosphate acyltransferase
MAPMVRETLLEMGPSVPRRGWWLGRAVGRAVMWVAGWSFAGSIPDLSKTVIIVAPHTSNWDFVIGAAGMLALDLDLRFLGKHTLFRGPMGVIMRLLGGIPVDRAQPGGGVVAEMGERFKNSDHLVLALAPEGTRGEVTRWKTGFHQIARAAGVPIVAATLDYGRRQIRFREPFEPSGNVEADVEELQEFFADSHGRR